MHISRTAAPAEDDQVRWQRPNGLSMSIVQIRIGLAGIPQSLRIIATGPPTLDRDSIPTTIPARFGVRRAGTIRMGSIVWLVAGD